MLRLLIFMLPILFGCIPAFAQKADLSISDLFIPNDECTDTVTLGQESKVCRDEKGIYRILPLKIADQMTFDDLKSDLASLDDTSGNSDKPIEFLHRISRFREVLNHRPYDITNTMIAVNGLEGIVNTYLPINNAQPNNKLEEKSKELTPPEIESLNLQPLDGTQLTQKIFLAPIKPIVNNISQRTSSNALPKSAPSIYNYAIFAAIFCYATRFMFFKINKKNRKRSGGQKHQRKSHYQSNAKADGNRQKSTASWFEILGVSSNCSLEEATKAYRSLAKGCHPDLVRHLDPALAKVAHEKFIQYGKAYEEAEDILR